MKHVPSPVEILQHIIDEDGSCDWATNECNAPPLYYICKKCPIGQLYCYPGEDGFCGCIHSVARFTGSTTPSDIEYKQVAIKLLEDLEMDNLLTREKTEDRE